MDNTLIFLRHGKTVIDKSVPIDNWDLTEEAKKACIGMAESGIFDDVDIFVSSCEKKAYLTVKPFAERLKKEIVRIEGLGEIGRGGAAAISAEKYDELKRKAFEDFDHTEMGWETANHALSRFRRAVEQIDKEHDGKRVLIGSHGTVMTLFFAYLKNDLGNIFARWESLGFLEYGIVKNGEVIKDIV